jgi:hypothetical protein
MAEEKDVNNDIGVEELRDQLDALWEKHLILLDSYHQAQQQIARHFSTGFFDLAQATFKSTTRVRYGQEYYDDRMHATTRFEASVDKQDTPRLALMVNDTPSSSTKPSNTDTPEKSPDSNTEKKPTHKNKNRKTNLRTKRRHTTKFAIRYTGTASWCLPRCVHLKSLSFLPSTTQS